jgi:hypothetical protein
MQQVITIGPDGSVSGLHHKKGQGLDLRQFGKAQIERASHIVWDEQAQAWQVEVLTGPYAGLTLTWSMWREATHLDDCPAALPSDQRDDATIQFAEYEDGVRAEIMVLNALRLKGLF